MDGSSIVNIKADDLAGFLEGALNHPNKKHLAKFLISEINEGEILAKILFNTFVLPKFKKGDVVKVNYNSLYTWNIDKGLMEQNGLILPGDTVKVTIHEVSPYSREPYLLKYNYYNDTSKELDSQTGQTISEDKIILGLNNK